METLTTIYRILLIACAVCVLVGLVRALVRWEDTLKALGKGPSKSALGDQARSKIDKAQGGTQRMRSNGDQT